jgi:two-component system, OmpR family, KDP operon response regulator KdpE
VSATGGSSALVVEDDATIRATLRAALETNGWSVDEAATLRAALAATQAKTFGLALIDLGLPDGDGVDLIASIRSRAQTPIVVLSARSEEQQKVRALDAGADDYIEKPFRAAEFLARVRAHVRRTQLREGDGGARIVLGNVEFDRELRSVRKNGAEVHLTRIEFKLFGVLVANAGRVLTHRQLLHDVWGPGRVEHAHYLRVFMASLRQKLEDDPAQPKLLLTETGVGYRLSV